MGRTLGDGGIRLWWRAQEREAHCRCSNGVVACRFGGISMGGLDGWREVRVCICGGDYLGRMDVLIRWRQLVVHYQPAVEREYQREDFIVVDHVFFPFVACDVPLVK